MADLFNEKVNNSWKSLRQNVESYPNVLVSNILSPEDLGNMTISQLIKKLTKHMRQHDKTEIAKSEAERRAKYVENMTPEELKAYEEWEQLKKKLVEIANTPTPTEPRPGFFLDPFERRK